MGTVSTEFLVKKKHLECVAISRGYLPVALVPGSEVEINYREYVVVGVNTVVNLHVVTGKPNPCDADVTYQVHLREVE